MSLPQKLFVKNRQNIAQLLSGNSVLVLFSAPKYPKNGDQFYLYRQQSDLYYFTGIKQEDTIFLMHKKTNGSIETFLFIREPDSKLETWEGKKLSQQMANDISGIDQVIWNYQFENIFKSVSKGVKTLYLIGEQAYSSKNDFKKIFNASKTKLQKITGPVNLVSARSLIDQLRLIKSPCEVDAIKKAIGITNESFQHVLRTIKPGQYEYEVEAEISYIFKKNGVKSHAYDPIIAGGINACSLHYITNDKPLNNNDLLLMDFGAEWEYYAADLSRTIPVSGKFTSRQKDIYEAVLEVQKKSIDLYVPGNSINDVNAETKFWMEQRIKQLGLKDAVEVYFPHGTSHFLGLDVHDVGARDLIFKKGMVLTCEPGLYIKEEKIGVRIENDILIDKTPIDLMSDTIREPAEIESQMSF
ncbi:MAG: aminopeptidase P N-terminal domain-containing protein [Bacteroidales bacterium]|nr:aminopeptidase P N-terminal domain-containing protein [Bacteroidales bacterium]